VSTTGTRKHHLTVLSTVSSLLGCKSPVRVSTFGLNSLELGQAEVYFLHVPTRIEYTKVQQRCVFLRKGALNFKIIYHMQKLISNTFCSRSGKTVTGAIWIRLRTCNRNQTAPVIHRLCFRVRSSDCETLFQTLSLRLMKDYVSRSNYSR